MDITQQEQQHLSQVLDYIRRQLGDYQQSGKDLRAYILEQRRRTWDDFARASENPDGYQEVLQIAQTEQRDVQRFERIEEQKKVLAMLADNPYFARLDVEEDGDVDTMYIGRRALVQEETSDLLVCDWRSDIAALFYESGLGKTQYSGPYGKIDCNLLLRRQFRIEQGKLLAWFDSDIAIEDDILQAQLGSDSDTKLKTIVSTIQKEQNAVIRNLTDRLVLVSGVAGSGKTSIALHRLAYLMYRLRGKLSSAEIIIFSPNNVFNSYIADVLPDLGEEKVIQTSMVEYFGRYLRGKTVLSATEQAERLLHHRTDPAEIVQKGSEEFRLHLQRFFEAHAAEYVRPQDLMYYDEVVYTQQQLYTLYFEECRAYKPAIRVRKILDGLEEYLETTFRGTRDKQYQLQVTENGAIAFTDEELQQEIEACWQSDKNRILQQARQMLQINVYRMYVQALEEISAPMAEQCRQLFAQNQVRYEDLFALCYLLFLCGSLPTCPKIKHVVVDEAQDYPPLVYRLMAQVFSGASHTVLGDLNQAFLPHFEQLKQIALCYEPISARYFELHKSYRSTIEINTYLSGIVSNGADMTFFARHGRPVQTVSCSQLEQVVKELAAFRSKAVVCKDEEECQCVYQRLKAAGISTTLLGSEDILYPDRTVVVASYLTKGLEFDAVVVADASEKNWATPMEKQAFYVGASRAMHALVLCRDDESSDMDGCSR